MGWRKASLKCQRKQARTQSSGEKGIVQVQTLQEADTKTELNPQDIYWRKYLYRLREEGEHVSGLQCWSDTCERRKRRKESWVGKA